MTAAVPLSHVLLLATALFTIGTIGLMVRRNVLFMLIATEVMLNAAGLAFIGAGQRWGQADGQVMFIFILTMAAAELAVGLVIVQKIWLAYRSLDTRQISSMGG